MVKSVAYGDFPRAYGKIDFTKVVVDYALKDVPEDLKCQLEGEVRELVADGWTSFDFSLPDNIPDRPWQNDHAVERLFEGKGLADELKEKVGRRLYEASVWLIQRSLIMLVLKHGKQWGGWDGTPEDLDFDCIEGAQLEMPMSLVEGSNICLLSHAVEGGKLVLKALSTLVR